MVKGIVTGIVKGTSDFAGSVDLVVVVTTVVNVADVDANVDADVRCEHHHALSNLSNQYFVPLTIDRSIDRSATGHAMAVKNMLQTGHLLNAFTRKWGNGIILLLPPGFDKLSVSIFYLLLFYYIRATNNT
ncbi:hypothetical protein AYO21_02744 [Fonsecaea monophora]|uniref:Uncharacterized protein n=1 Tax=Fonsecaea monophora TaxID=254056 RepID=A0A177FFY0_9EURO|nr:hypothetical protein AYO21_02744 [Fonsecaea monophora]OAG43125.1 hypothetical protein AYO21_02744 [Fonsecaea monophora]